MLVECATHAILAAPVGPYRAPEREICQPLLGTSRKRGADKAITARILTYALPEVEPSAAPTLVP